MLNNGNKTNCGFADEIVSYIYDEIGASERAKFETHLADCTVCTDEFAAISNARFSVFEWQKEEFAHLPMPGIVIPYATKSSVAEENAPAGLLAGLRGWLSLVNFPVTVAAVLAVSVGLGFLAMTYLGVGDQQIANVEVNDRSAPSVAVIDDPRVIDTKAAPKTPEISVTTPSANNNKSGEIQPGKASVILRPKLERQMTADNQTPINDAGNRNVTPKIRKAPVLSNYEDSDDSSLRLSDLFDEFGG